MQIPGNAFVGRCTHCGRKDRVVVVVNCNWPDKKFTVERLCEDECYGVWGAQLISLGCVLDPSPGIHAIA